MSAAAAATVPLRTWPSCHHHHHYQRRRNHHQHKSTVLAIRTRILNLSLHTIKNEQETVPYQILLRRSDSTLVSFNRLETQHGTLLSFTIIQRRPPHRPPHDGQRPRKTCRPQRRRYVQRLNIYLYLHSCLHLLSQIRHWIITALVALHAICYL